MPLIQCVYNKVAMAIRVAASWSSFQVDWAAVKSFGFINSIGSPLGCTDPGNTVKCLSPRISTIILFDSKASRFLAAFTRYSRWLLGFDFRPNMQFVSGKNQSAN